MDFLPKKSPFLAYKDKKWGSKLSVSFPSSEQGIQEQKSMRIIARSRKEVKDECF
jgi:hypothetical protein